MNLSKKKDGGTEKKVLFPAVKEDLNDSVIEEIREESILKINHVRAMLRNVTKSVKEIVESDII